MADEQLPKAILHGAEWIVGGDAPRVMPEVLYRAAMPRPGQTPDNRLVFLDDVGQARSLTYAELLADADRVMAGLQQQGLTAGDIVLFQLRQSADLVTALWACFLGGFVPLPVAVPDRYDEPSGRLEAVRSGWMLAGRPFVLTNTETAAALRNGSVLPPGNQSRVVELLNRHDSPRRGSRHRSQPQDPALLILTSGSTAQPKLVVLTHQNLLSAAIGSAEAIGLVASDTNLNWMPMTHIGALAFHIRDVTTGARQIHVPTQYVLEQPLRWLDLLEAYSVTTCWAPNSAYGLVNEQALEIHPGRWDLSRVRVLLNGSEAIVASTARQFLELLQPCGLASSCMVPCWGMSETAAAVTYNRHFRPTCQAGPIGEPVETGAPIAGVSLRVVDDSGDVVGEGVNGQLQIRGLPVTPGYFHDQSATDEAVADERWWRTGDRAFLRNGQLTVTGREKNLLIVNGVNYSCEAIEAAAKEVEGVQSAAAIAVRSETGDTDSLAVFCTSLAPSLGEDRSLLEEVRRRILSRMGVNPRVLVLLRPDEMPRTATGKIRHHDLKRQFEAGAFQARIRDECRDVPGDPRAIDDGERQLTEIMGRVLGCSQVGLDESFFDLGGDSLRAMQLTARIREAFGVSLPLQQLFRTPTARELSPLLRRTAPELERQEPAEDQGPREVPLAPAQQRLWLVSQLNPDDPSYHVSAAVDHGDPTISAFELAGPLDVAALVQSLRTIAARHETLRTVLPVTGGVARQRILPPGTIDFQRVDLRSYGVRERDELLRQHAQRQHETPFDLECGPLWRATLIQTEEERYLFFLVLHHLICDGWSVGNLRRELTAAYEAHREGRAPRLPILVRQYADYATSRRAMEESDEMAGQREYWRRRLQGTTPTLLPTDRPRSAMPSHRGGLRIQIISPRLSRAIGELSRRNEVTPFITLLAAFKLLCFRYLDQRDVTLGSPISNRGRPEWENLIGHFVNTLVLRTSLAGNLTFRDLLARVRETVVEAVAHQDFPFERLVEDLQPARHPAANPVFNIMFAFHNLPLEPLHLDRVAVASRSFPTSSVRFDVQWDLWQQPDESLRINVFHRHELYDAQTVDRWLGHYVRILEAIAADPERCLEDIPLVSDDERQELLETLGGAPCPERTARYVHEIFEQQAAETPGAVAIIGGGRPWQYGELNERSQRIAARLQVEGVRPETVVALACDRSPDIIAGMLGILKAGGAYLALDLHQPESRILEMWRAANPQIVLADARAADRLVRLGVAAPAAAAASANAAASTPAPANAVAPGNTVTAAKIRVVSLDDEALWQAIPSRWFRPAGPVNGQRWACCMSTSGTAGGAKSVAVLHDGIVRLVHQASFVNAGPTDVFLQLAPPAFDASLFEIWFPLLNGARLVVPPAGPVSVEEIERLVEIHGVTILWLTAGLFHLMVRRKSPCLVRLRVLIAGGDVLSPELVNEFLSRSTSTTLINGYGPTENTTFTCCHGMNPGDETIGSVPIGRPLSGTHVYVLDRAMNLVPRGAVGELYTGGFGLTRGYASRASETAERFLPDPFSQRPGARLYRSGDLVRWRSDGTLEFLGRLDRQLKIHGYRVHPAELETVMREHRAVREALVVAYNVPGGDKQLVGYVVSDCEEVGPEVRNLLRTRFPEPLVPRVILTVSEMPLTIEGKVDHRRLPAPQFDRQANNSQTPRTATEQKLADIWCSLLRLPRVGIHDNFFDLGGESLAAMQLVSRVWDELQVVLPLRRVFVSPTVAELAVAITQEIALRSDTNLLARALDEVEGMEVGNPASRPPGNLDREEPADNEC